MLWDGRRLVHSVMHVTRKPSEDQTLRLGHRAGKTMASGPTFDVKVRMMSGKEEIVAVRGDTRVRDIIYQLWEQMQIGYEHSVRLSFHDEAMDADKTFGFYGINRAWRTPATIDVVIVNEPPPWPREDWD